MYRIMLFAVLYAVPASAQYDVPTWRLNEQYRLGSISGPIIFNGISGVTVSPDRQLLYVAQRQEGGIRVFDAESGKFIKTIGRAGEGPGEFRYLTSIGWRADTLYATDFLLDRVVLFSPNGDHVRTSRSGSTFQPSIGRPSFPVGLTAAGYLIGQARYTSDILASGEVTTSPWSLVDQDGRLISLFATQDLRNTSAAAPIGTAVIYYVRPLSQRSILAVSPNGEHIVLISQPAGHDRPGTYRVTRFDPDGKERSSHEYHYEPRKVPEEYVDSVHSSVAESLAQLVPEGRAMTAARKYWEIPEYFPPVSRSVVTSTGEVWLQRNIDARGYASWLVLDQEGQPRANVIAPAALRIHYADESSAWGVITGELDVEELVKFNLTR